MASYYHLSYSKQSTFRPFAKRSIYWHIALALILLFLASLHKIISPAKITNVHIIESSVRVDVVAMPTKTYLELKAINMGTRTTNIQDIIKIDASETSKPIVAKDAPVLLKKNKIKKMSFQEMMQKMAKKKLAKQKLAAKPRSKKRKTLNPSTASKRLIFSEKEKSELQGLILAGNKLSSGVSAVGDKGTEDLTKFQDYVSKLPEMVRPHWKLPSYLYDKGLKCRVRIFLSADGRLLTAVIYSSSGNAEYDKLALNAVYATTPFPQLDKLIKDRGRKGEIVLGFPL